MGLRVGAENGQGALLMRGELHPTRIAAGQDFVPVPLGQRIHGKERPDMLPAQRSERVAGDAALAGVRQSDQPQGSYQIWPGYEKPTDNWL